MTGVPASEDEAALAVWEELRAVGQAAMLIVAVSDYPLLVTSLWALADPEGSGVDDAESVAVLQARVLNMSARNGQPLVTNSEEIIDLSPSGNKVLENVAEVSRKMMPLALCYMTIGSAIAEGNILEACDAALDLALVREELGNDGLQVLADTIGLQLSWAAGTWPGASFVTRRPDTDRCQVLARLMDEAALAELKKSIFLRACGLDAEALDGELAHLYDLIE